MSCALWADEMTAQHTLAIALEAARAFGEAIQATRRDGLAKGAGHDVVTAADGASERILSEHLARPFPIIASRAKKALPLARRIARGSGISIPLMAPPILAVAFPIGR